MGTSSWMPMANFGTHHSRIIVTAMKKIALAVCLATLSACGSANAQGFLNKIASNLQLSTIKPGTSAKGDPSKKQLKMAEEDLNDATLDAKAVAADPTKRSGIYYTTELLFANNATEQNTKVCNKFLINFETKGFATKATVYSRYSYKDEAVDKVEPLIVYSNEAQSEIARMANVCDVIYTDAYVSWSYITNRSEPTVNNGGESIYPTKEIPEYTSIGGMGWFLYKPGIIIIFPNQFEVNDNTQQKKQESVFKYTRHIVLYKKSNEQEAKALTREQVIEYLKGRYTKSRPAAAKWSKDYEDKLNKAVAESRAAAAANGGGSSSSSSSKASAGNGKFWGKLQNKSGETLDIIIHSPKGSSKSITSICSRCTKSFEMQAGGKITRKDGSLILMISEAMNGKETIIAQ
jgi:hypothetical protein